MESDSFASLSRVEISGPASRKHDDGAFLDIGRYTLHAELAVGGMATVYLGRSVGAVGFSRTVAVKRLHKQFAHDPGFVAMFHDEARLAARIRHPNVVPTLDVVATDGELFLVMEYIHGETLGRLIGLAQKREGRIPLRIGVALVVSVLLGLHAAHEATDEFGKPLDVVHRDISPHNILVGADGIVRVVDFGIAKARGRLQSTRDGELKGKLAYMAPEQVRGSLDVSRRADIYSTGIVLWEVVAGKRLFHADNDAALLSRVVEAKVPTLANLVPEVPPSIDAIVRRALSQDPNERFQTAREMSVALENAVPIASASEVAAWLERIAGGKLRERAERIAEIEQAQATRISSRSMIAEVNASESSVSRKSRASLASIPPHRERHPYLLSGLVALVIVVLGIGAAYAIANRAAARDREPLPLELRPTSAETSEPSARPTASEISLDPVQPKEPDPGSTTPIAPSATSPRPPATKATHGKGTKCAIPYTIDAAGNKVFKPECM